MAALADCVEEVGDATLRDGSVTKRPLVRFGSGEPWSGQPDQLCQSSEVLGGGGKEELVVSAVRASQPEPVQA